MTTGVFRSVFRAILVAGVLAILQACDRPKYLSADELSRYVLDEGNGLVKKTSSGANTMQVIYRPIDLMVLQQLGNRTSPVAEEVQRIRARFDKHYYFIVRFAQAGRDVVDPAVQGVNGFSDLLQTVSFRMSEYVKLSTPEDTIAVADYVYDRSFGMGQGTDILFVFEKEKVADQEWFDLNVEEFGLGMGKQSVRFQVSDLQNAPQIFQ